MVDSKVNSSLVIYCRKKIMEPWNLERSSPCFEAQRAVCVYLTLINFELQVQVRIDKSSDNSATGPKFGYSLLMQAYWSWIGEEHFQMSFFFQRAGGGAEAGAVICWLLSYWFNCLFPPGPACS